MTNSLPTRKDIKELTDFIPLLYDENITLYTTNPEGDIFGGGYYSYHSSVNTFFELASKPYWADYQYLENFSEEMIKPGKIEKASLDRLKTILTWCVRIERFNEGHWIAVIEDRVIKRILERLQLLGKDLK